MEDEGEGCWQYFWPEVQIPSYCCHCWRKGHSVSQCHVLHPELKPSSQAPPPKPKPHQAYRIKEKPSSLPTPSIDLDDRSGSGNPENKGKSKVDGQDHPPANERPMDLTAEACSSDLPIIFIDPPHSEGPQTLTLDSLPPSSPKNKAANPPSLFPLQEINSKEPTPTPIMELESTTHSISPIPVDNSGKAPVSPSKIDTVERPAATPPPTLKDINSNEPPPTSNMVTEGTPQALSHTPEISSGKAPTSPSKSDTEHGSIAASDKTPFPNMCLMPKTSSCSALIALDDDPIISASPCALQSVSALPSINLCVDLGPPTCSVNPELDDDKDGYIKIQNKKNKQMKKLLSKPSIQTRASNATKPKLK